MNNNKTIVIKNRKGISLIDLNDVYFFEKNARVVTIVLKNSSFKYYGTFKDLEQIIDENIFFRCHKSFIINVNKILTIYQDEITFKDIGENAYLSKSSKKALIDILKNNANTVFM